MTDLLTTMDACGVYFDIVSTVHHYCNDLVLSNDRLSLVSVY